MKRQIKSRGKRVDTGEWIFGDLLTSNGTECEISDWNDVVYSRYDVDPDTVGQFTGLFDKNGTEAYEDDIVRFTYSYEKQGYHTIVTNTYIGVIALNKYFHTCIMVGNEEYHIDNCIRNGEIIGNIHDNPELLKGGEE